ncbi:DUF2637 domain-containing protein [Streptomyces sp. NPDC049881]|uniref:DUF2637 domain-containing protein n=1 Tax=Streptomyces sp. NPDC049881 TaxID=3155778 RepID=UPI00343248B2
MALTGAAFWLSYAHLADIAMAHGLSGERAWAWPATLDLGVIAGELLMLRAALQRRVDWWAIGLMVSSAGGSIVLNVAGVGDRGEPLDYVVAGVPPTAALVAFGVMMRQIHRWLATDQFSTVHPEEPGVHLDAPAISRVSNHTPGPADQSLVPVQVDTPGVQVDTPARESGATPASPVYTPHRDEPPDALGTGQETVVSPLVICGGHRVYTPDAPARPRLSTEEANAVIEQCWREGVSLRKAALKATRSRALVQQVYTRLDTERGPRPVPGQLAHVSGPGDRQEVSA